VNNDGYFEYFESLWIQKYFEMSKSYLFKMMIKYNKIIKVLNYKMLISYIAYLVKIV